MKKKKTKWNENENEKWRDKKGKKEIIHSYNDVKSLRIIRRKFPFKEAIFSVHWSDEEKFMP